MNNNRVFVLFFVFFCNISIAAPIIFPHHQGTIFPEASFIKVKNAFTQNCLKQNFDIRKNPQLSGQKVICERKWSEELKEELPVEIRDKVNHPKTVLFFEIYPASKGIEVSGSLYVQYEDKSSQIITVLDKNKEDQTTLKNILQQVQNSF